ncbi:hypothetical protein OA238_c38550 [Octadecabacter arcticus 238]|jgi:hypothetical protein|uniref:Uncharacterized protein n=1 Tax=Octadecabacter arcticus 238 TaxID=391616 RepID=M9RVC5_9RHOB|nr:hypothetical protein [Octadecabacter arcticus]AGI73800.1 hypothetical protein OA238_c38550 [Octadecabacter arcticus 238]|tara:strand:+ start:676 stop:987 length:312 start_codon:yes stop_codon:yes gene_type:complete
MTAFLAALDLLFADLNLAHEAWYRDSEGQFTRIRIILRRNDDVTAFGAARLVSDTCRFDVRVSELPAPRPDEQILLGEETFLIQGEPLRDRDRLVWTIEATPA